MPPRAFSLAARLWLTAFMALLGSVALLVVALRTVDQVKIRGPLYQDIVSYKDLLADILPPPAYLIESYLTCFELTKGDGQENPALLKKLSTLESDYAERNAFWVKELKNPGLRQSMLNEATLPAQVYFDVVKKDFVPAVQAGDMDQARKVLYGPLTDAYRKHRTAIDKTVELANKEVTVVEGTADTALSGSMRMLLASAIGINLIVLLLTYFSIRSIMKPMSTLTTYAKRVSGGDYDCTCEITATSEIGSLAEVLADTVGKVKESLLRASESERMAQAEADNARMSSAKAEQAKVKAESAKQEGMLQAATKLEQVVEVLGSASERLATQIKQSSAGADVQAEKAADVATAMEEMHATVGEVAKSASHTAETSALAQTKAQEGAQVVKRVIIGIESVQHTAATLKDQITDLGRQSESIGQILNVISDIADQTNLLALNAAIEAARAGDAGRGFAVVADEVRKLAEKTMTATKQVGEAISGVQACTRANIAQVDEAVSAITDATKLATKSGEALQDIVQLVGKASEQVSSIAAAAEQQSAASDEINQAIDEVNAISRESSSAMNEATDAVLELARQAGDLRSLILELKTDTATATA